MVNGKKVYIARSNALHVMMKKAKTTNAKSIKVNKTKVPLNRYLTTNSRIATASKPGVITARAKGTCDIYIFANNGVYKKVKVTVK